MGNAWADTHRNRHGTLAPHSVPTRAPPPSAQSYRPHSGYRGPWSHLSWVSPPLGPDQGNSYPTTCGSTVCRDGPSTSPRTARSSRRRPLPLTHAPPSLSVDHIRSPGRPRPFAPQPLRYAGGSQLLRASPPARPASVLSPSRIPPLGVLPLACPPHSLPLGTDTPVSGRAFTCSRREPGPGSCCLYAGHHLGSKRLSPRFLPE